MKYFSLIVVFFNLQSCNGDKGINKNTPLIITKKDSLDFKKKESNFISKLDTIHLAELKYFNPLISYKNIIDTSAFLRKVAFKYAFAELYPDTIFNKENDDSKIILFNKINIYGSDQKVFLLLMQHPERGTSSLPNNALFVYSEKAKLLLYQSHCGTFKEIKIIKNKNSFLLSSEETGKGNGTHRLYKFKKYSLVNVLNTGDWDIHTIDKHVDENEYNPAHMTIGITDIDNDGYNDLEFSTTLVVHCETKTIKKKLVYHFLFNPKSEVFNPKRNYNFQNNYNLCK